MFDSQDIVIAANACFTEPPVSTADGREAQASLPYDDTSSRPLLPYFPTCQPQKSP
jgi:hypothetical protein